MTAPRTAVMYSGGVCSHMAAKRWIGKHGKDGVVLLFSDTGLEDDDLYRFVQQGSDFLNVPLVRLSSGEHFDDMIRRHRALPNNRMPFCSREQKVKPSVKWLERNKTVDTLVFGLDWTETHRLPRVQARWPGFTVEAPMMDAPYKMKPEMLAELRDDGIDPPRLYALGFKHNNCGGGCVRNGVAAWRLLYHALPDRYEEWCRREELIPGSTFAKDTSGSRPPISLREISAREPNKCDTLDWGGCGCFVDEDKED